MDTQLNKITVTVDVPEDMDLDHLYTVVADALYLPDNVTQAHYDLILMFINKIQEVKNATKG